MYTIMLSCPPTLVNTQAFHNILFFKTEEKAKQTYADIVRWLKEKLVIEIVDDYNHHIFLQPGICNGCNYASSFEEHEFNKDLQAIQDHLKFATENTAQRLMRSGFKIN